jgi:O-antigen/teichoic acid export membrane protein
VVKSGLFGGGAQAVSSLSNALMVVVVAHELGAATLGQFGFLFMLLTLFVAVQTAWVGDSLVVLDRADERVRRGIATTQWLHVLGALVLGPIIAVVTTGVDAQTAALFGVLTAAWELEEFGRRALMARLEFGRQLAADSSYLVISLSALLAFHVANRLDLATVLTAMLFGAIGSFVLEMFLVPRNERLLLPSLTLDGLVDVAQFGIWRAAQSGTGYVGQTAYRYAVIAFGSLALLGSIEAARLIAAPLFTILGAANNVLLPIFARTSRSLSVHRVGIVASALVGICVLYGGVVAVTFGSTVHVVIGDKVHVPHSSVVAWFALAVAAAVATPVTVSWVARGASRVVFQARAVGTLLGLLVSVGCCVAGAVLVSPLGLAFGSLINAALLGRVGSADRKRTLAGWRLRPLLARLGGVR